MSAHPTASGPAPVAATTLPTPVLGPRQVTLTLRGAVIVGLGIMGAVAAWRLEQPTITAVGVAAAVAVLTAMVWQGLAPAPTVRVAAATDLVDIDGSVDVHVVVERPRATVDVVWPAVDDPAGPRVRGRTPELRSRQADGDDAHFSRRLRPQVRMHVSAGPVAVLRWDPFAVCRTRFLLDDSAPVDVAPRLLEVPALPWSRVSGRGATSVGYAGNRAMHARTWQPGDQRRDVHWRATARTGQLMAHDNDSVSPDQVLVIVEGGVDALDAVRVAWAASIAAQLARMGWTVGFGSPDSITAVRDPEGIRRIAARLPRTSTGWSDVSAFSDDEELRIVAVVTPLGAQNLPPGRGAAVVLCDEGGPSLSDAVQAAREAGWETVGVQPEAADASELAEALTALAAGRSGRT